MPIKSPIHLVFVALFGAVLFLDTPSFPEVSDNHSGSDFQEAPFFQITPGLAEETADGQTYTSSVNGILHPARETTLSSQLDAAIVRLSVKEGEAFRKGQELVVFDCRVYRARLKKAKSEVTIAREEVKSNKELESFQSVSRLALAISEAELTRAKAEEEEAKTRVSRCSIYAPFAGRVVKRHAHPHQYLSRGDELLEILDHRRLYLHFLISSDWLKWVKPGLTFPVRIRETGDRYEASIALLGAKVDPVSRTIKVRADIKGVHPELMAGMSGTAYFNPPTPPPSSLNSSLSGLEAYDLPPSLSTLP
ncbi:MAG: efflux RND transporter periplasmic adaptor subunit [Magnetococcales bacterium]|nr:efflux RND transporter periplasmic adaptor subunit [Magnetococcales bacterium]